MDGVGCVRFCLELEVGGEVIAGRLLGEAGVERRFEGVLDLLGALNNARSAPGAQSSLMAGGDVADGRDVSQVAGPAGREIGGNGPPAKVGEEGT